MAPSGGCGRKSVPLPVLVSTGSQHSWAHCPIRHLLGQAEETSLYVFVSLCVSLSAYVYVSTSMSACLCLCECIYLYLPLTSASGVTSSLPLTSLPSSYKALVTTVDPLRYSRIRSLPQDPELNPLFKIPFTTESYIHKSQGLGSGSIWELLFDLPNWALIESHSYIVTTIM